MSPEQRVPRTTPEQLVSVTHPGNTEPDIRYGYDAKGNRTSVRTPSGTTAYAYDELNRLRTVTEPDGMSETAYTYDTVGNRKTVTCPNGTETEYFYDDLNRLEGMENRKADGTLISSYEYDLGDAGNRLSVTENTGRVVNYDYDDLYRLVGEEILDPTSGNETVSYTYDDFGNRLSKTDATGTTSYHYDDNDQLYAEILPDGTTVSYGYDDNGNTLTKGDGTYTTTYSWDSENRLISVDDGVSVTDYEYDADGVRVSAETDGEVTIYLVDKNRDYAQVLEDRDGSGGLIVAYVYGDDLVRQVRGGVLSYYHYDGQLSVRQLSDADGDVSDDYVYDAFGALLGQSGDTVNDYLYTGEQFDEAVDGYYLRARYYDQGTGRFVSSDPWQGRINEPMTLHKYLYANANPIINRDPSGYNQCRFLKKIKECQTESLAVFF
ncbi:RHS repeat-associated core domain-containing pro tein [Desulfonema ishimotonii]|uniref:RHS repeat-associated core domain-containing pro tein n=1 Tax=Desulfonema ishimotonii TaxID=45657 RepID=A0A401FVI1_9BACT|nr:RHS repeat-associated core domain-containing protein [Desulfonema ishimotonii]GBC60970.1 RHS repeat-associated core domain-containing pro tein [Desulfonema ishimotonii]